MYGRIGSILRCTCNLAGTFRLGPRGAIQASPLAIAVLPLAQPSVYLHLASTRRPRHSHPGSYLQPDVHHYRVDLARPQPLHALHPHLRLPAPPTRRLFFNPKPRICSLWSLRRRTGLLSSPNRVFFAALITTYSSQHQQRPIWPCSHAAMCLLAALVALPHFRHHSPLNTKHFDPCRNRPKHLQANLPVVSRSPSSLLAWLL